MNADRIIVVDDGTILEQGTHESLISAGGKYAELWSKQVRLFWSMLWKRRMLISLSAQTFIRPKADPHETMSEQGAHDTKGSTAAKTESTKTRAQGSTEDDDAQTEQVKTPSGHRREV